MKKLLLVFLLAILIIPVAVAPASISQGERIAEYEFMLNKEMKAKQFELFIEHLGLRESNNQWWITNSIGCIGKWQFTQSTLAYLGYPYITTKKFRRDATIFPEELQKQVLLSLIKMNEVILKDYTSYIGKVVSGVTITRSGMIAAAHLGGAGSVKIFLSSDGRINSHDQYGTSIKKYMNDFAMYDF